MRKFNVLLLLLIALSIIVVGVQAQEEMQPVTKMAEDVDCRKCHTDSPHVIHDGKPVQCTNCHGQTLSIKIPQCTQCHTGPIHQVHIGKVNTEDCSHCHSGIETFHSDMISTTLCSHCHNDLVQVHGGPDISCEKCHAKAPDIVKPLQLEGTTVVCQNCHTSPDVAQIHGEVDNKSSCYRCHRPGAQEIEAASEIPHFIHIPKVDCNKCHLSQETGKVYIPVCTQCHTVEKIHSFQGIGLKTAATGLKCAVCHPMSADGEVSATAIATKAPVTPGKTEPESKTPGFGTVLAISSLALIYLARRFQK